MRKKDIADLRAKAAKYRTIARQTTDDKTAHEIFTLAEELERQARDMENE